MREIQKADPRVRRWTMIVFLGCAALGATAVLAFLRYHSALEAWVFQELTQESQHFKIVLGVSGVVFFLPLVGLAVYLWQLGDRVGRTQRFPPLGMAVIRDTPVLQGQAAKRQGVLIQSLAVVLAVSVSVVIGLLWLLVGMLVNP